MSESPKPRLSRAGIVEKIVIVLVTVQGINGLASPLRRMFIKWIETSIADPGLAHVGLYLGHAIFLAGMLLYGWAVKRDRPYITGMFHGSARRNALYGLLGAVMGFGAMGVCVFAASAHGDIAIQPSASVQIPLFLLALPVVFIQSSTEEIETRGFAFGKMKAEGVPLLVAVACSAFYFAYIHINNEGFGILPLLGIFVVGFQYALCCHYFGTIWFTCGAHALWNFTQDFIFGLPDSGKPAAVSIFNTTVKGSSFFYDQAFGIEGSAMALLVNLALCGVIFIIGRRLQEKGR